MNTHRRELLKAAGAGALLSQFAGRFTGEAQAAPPKRFIMFWHANGSPTGGDKSFADPVAKAPGGISFSSVTYSGTGDHKFGMPFSVTGRTDNPPKSISIDQAIAKSSGKPALVLTGKFGAQNYRSWCSFSSNGSPILGIENPREAFASVFGLDPGKGAGGGTDPTDPIDPKDPTQPKPAPTTHDPAIEKAILDRAMADIRQIRSRLPKIELEKMDAQLEALGRIASNIDPLVPQSQPLTLVKGCAPKEMLAETFREPSEGFDYPTRVKLHIELIVAAFACDSRRVATLMMTPGGHDWMEYGFIGVPGKDPHNTIAHYIGKDPANVEKMRKIKRYEMEQLAYLIKRLSETPDSDGKSLLDSTVIFAPTECKDGNHGHVPVPVIVAGQRTGVGGGDYKAILSSVAKAAGGSFSA